jgi:hypothetical protein
LEQLRYILLKDYAQRLSTEFCVEYKSTRFQEILRLHFSNIEFCTDTNLNVGTVCYLKPLSLAFCNLLETHRILQKKNAELTVSRTTTGS